MLKNGADLLLYCTSDHDAHMMGWVVGSDDPEKQHIEIKLICAVCKRTCILMIDAVHKVAMVNDELRH